MSNPEDSNFDDQQNRPEEEQSDLDFFNSETESISGQESQSDQLAEFFDFADDSTSGSEPELDAFLDLGSSEAEELIVADSEVESPEFPLTEDMPFEDAQLFAETAEVIDLPEVADFAEAEELFEAELVDADTVEAVEMIEDEPFAEVAPFEEATAITDKKSKRQKKEKAPKVKKEKPAKVKKEKAPKPKREKKPKEPGEKKPQNVSALAFMVGIVLMLLFFGGVNLYAVIKYGIGSAMIFLAIFDLMALAALAIPFLLRRTQNKTECDVALGMATISLIIGCMALLCNIAIN